MRNREIINFLIYPKYFCSLAIPYKGKYFVKIRVLLKKTLNGKLTFAYPSMKMFTEKSSLKHCSSGSVNVDVSFYLFYSDQKLVLNSYCIFKVQYDDSREFKTFFEFQLIKRNQQNSGSQTCLPSQNNNTEEQLICKEIYQVNDYKRLHLFERVYFHHHQFYCALDLFMCSVSEGYVNRIKKFQLVEFSCDQNLQKKQKKTYSSKNTPSLVDSIKNINNQVKQYSQIRQIYLKYQLSLKAKKSFLFQQSTEHPQNFQDLSYLKYSTNDYDQMNLYDAVAQINNDKKNLNDNILLIFYKLPSLIKQLPFVTFKYHIKQSLKRKLDLKKKYLLKKVINHSFSFNNSSIYNLQSSKKPFQESTEQIQILRNSSTFKQHKKSQKNQFIHIRRQQFKKAFQIINFNDCNFPMMLIQSINPIVLNDNRTICNKESSNKQDKSQSDYDHMHLIILIHGYHGSHYDLKKLRNYLEHLNPKFRILAVNSIQKDIGENIQFLGEKVANQINFYIENCSECIKSISFIGFSLGGVLARACLKYLQKYKDLMQLLITLASPHLGVSESENTLVNFGIWYLSKIDKAKNIKQLNFQSVTEKNSYLMKLSQSDEISWFKKVVILSCSQDEFVPHYSARIMSDTKNQQINKMAKNIMRRIRNCQKIQVWFDVLQSSTFDRVIGRKSHIQFIENFSFLQTLCQMYQNEL